MDAEQKFDQSLPAAEQSAPSAVPQWDDTMPPAPATGEQLKRTEENIEKRMTDFERVTIRLTRVAIGISIVVAAAIIFQAVLMWQGGTDTAKIADAAGQIKGSANTSAKAAQSFATAADGIETKVGTAETDFSQIATNSATAIKETQAQMRLDQRAWVGITGVDVKILAVNKRFVYGGAVQNFGKTPAIKTTMLFMYKSILKGTKLTLDYPHSVVPQSIFTIPPGVQHPFGGVENPTDTPISQAQLDAISSGETTLYIYGDLEYHDIFQRHHYSHICAWVDRDLKTTHPCKFYNDTDDAPEKSPAN